MGMRDGAFWFRPHRVEHAFTASTFPIDTRFADSLSPVLVPTPDGFESSAQRNGLTGHGFLFLAMHFQNRRRS